MNETLARTNTITDECLWDGSKWFEFGQSFVRTPTDHSKVECRHDLSQVSYFSEKMKLVVHYEDLLVTPMEVAGSLITQHYTRIEQRDPSGVFNSIFLTSGNEGSSDLGHHCTETITFGLRMLSVSGGLSGYPPII